MKSNLHLIIVFFFAVFAFQAKAISPDPLFITENDGVENLGNLGPGMSIDYVRDSISNKTVGLFVRTPEAKDWDGIYYYEGGFNQGEGVSIGTDTISQYRYLIVEAKLSIVSPFLITLFRTEQNENVKTGTIPTISRVIANKWVKYVFDLSKGQNIPNKFFMLMLSPQTYDNNFAKVWLGKIYFSNRLPIK